MLYVDSAKQLKVENSCLALILPNEESHIIHWEDVLALVIENSYCSVSVPVLLICVEKGIPVILCNAKYQPEVFCIDLFRHNELLCCVSEQISWHSAKKKQAWCIILHAKLHHQKELLEFNMANLLAIENIEANIAKLLQENINESEINAIESISARMYFSSLFGNSFKRFEEDAINYALNYGYALIRAQIMVGLTIKGLHPALGIWHHSVRNRFNLADDIIEMLRPLVDYHVKSLKIETEFTKDHRQKMLSLLYANVFIGSTAYTLKQGVMVFLENFVAYMAKQTNNLTPITLKIEMYEQN